MLKMHPPSAAWVAQYAKVRSRMEAAIDKLARGVTPTKRAALEGHVKGCRITLASLNASRIAKPPTNPTEK